MANASSELTPGEPQAQRLDKWLWFARVAKTRTLASSFVSAGKVRVNKIKTEKPGTSIKVGDVITVAAHSKVRVLRVLAAGSRRGPATEAAMLYEDLSPPPQPASVATSPVETHAGGRPGKRERRAFETVRARHKFDG
ncbi:MAG: RNA-binding S4 domain-containing protein [Pseudomonadota bacterium]